jgi:hypothetical protein
MNLNKCIEILAQEITRLEKEWEEADTKNDYQAERQISKRLEQLNEAKRLIEDQG